MPTEQDQFSFGDFVFDSARRTLLRGGKPVAVGQRGLQVLQVLLEAQGQVIEKATLFEQAWPGLVVEESNLSVQIAALRKLLGRTPDGGDWIVTVPRYGYQLIGATAVSNAAGEALPGNQGHAGHAPEPRPSIVVLPFKNLSADPAQDYFADGITDDVIAALTRFRWFFVIGRSTSYAYRARQVEARELGRELGVGFLVQGSVRKAAERVRISVELVDARRGRCLWAEHYDFDLTDVFAVQDQIARKVAGSVEPELLKSETDSPVHRRPGSVTAWDLVARGCSFFHQVTEPTHRRAREFFRQARQVDPELAEAWIWLARVDAGILAFGWGEDVAEIRREGLAAAHEAVRRDEKNCYAHYSLAIMAVMSDELDLGIQAAEKAVDVSPSFALGHLVLGMALLYSGEPTAATQPLEQGLELNRHDPHNFVWYNVLALSLLFRGDTEGALGLARMSLKIRPLWRSSMETMAACCARLGRGDEAREWRVRLSGLAPAPGDALRPMWQRNPDWAASMRAWLTD